MRLQKPRSIRTRLPSGAERPAPALRREPRSPKNPGFPCRLARRQEIIIRSACLQNKAVTMLKLGARRLFAGAPHDGLQQMFPLFKRQAIRLELPVLDKATMRASRNHLAVQQQREASVARYIDLKRLAVSRTKCATVFDEQSAALIMRRRMRDPRCALDIVAHRKPGVPACVRRRTENALDLRKARPVKCRNSDHEQQDVFRFHFSR